MVYDHPRSDADVRWSAAKCMFCGVIAQRRLDKIVYGLNIMKYEMDITFNGEYIFAELSGDDSSAASLDAISRIAQACAENQCMKVLGLANLTPLSTMDAYDHYELFRKGGLTPEHQVAWVEMNGDTAKMNEFIVTVLANRGFYRVRLFSDVAEAKAWLLEEKNA